MWTESGALLQIATASTWSWRRTVRVRRKGVGSTNGSCASVSNINSSGSLGACFSLGFLGWYWSVADPVAHIRNVSWKSNPHRDRERPKPSFTERPSGHLHRVKMSILVAGDHSYLSCVGDDLWHERFVLSWVAAGDNVTIIPVFLTSRSRVEERSPSGASLRQPGAGTTFRAHHKVCFPEPVYVRRLIQEAERTGWRPRFRLSLGQRDGPWRVGTRSSGGHLAGA